MINLPPENREVTKYWLKHGVDQATGLCKYCANHGVQHIPEMKSPAGNIIPAHTAFCWCPNGQERLVVSTNGHGSKLSVGKHK